MSFLVRMTPVFVASVLRYAPCALNIKTKQGEIMKLLTPILVLFVGLTAMAQYGQLDPARQAERNARDAAVYGPGYLTPGNIQNPYYPPQPPPPPPRLRPPLRPLPPPPAPGGYYDVGPQVTVQWQDNGTNRIPKILSETVVVRVGNILTNEVLVRAIDNSVSIESAIAVLSDGRIVPLNQLQGTLRRDGEFRSLLDYRFSLRVNRIEIRASSGLIGSRGQLQVLVGLAQ